MFKGKIKWLLPIIAFLPIFLLIFVVVIAVCGGKIGDSIAERKVSEMRAISSVKNNQIYATRYRSLLNKYLTSKGYVNLERIVFYLQRTHNILDTSTLSYEEWEQAYLANVNEEEKQMIPIKTICEEFKENDNLPEFTIESGINVDGIQIEVNNLCIVDGKDITKIKDYDDYYYPLIYYFPLKSDFIITSYVFENRSVNLNLTPEQQERLDYHSGWDFDVPIGTNFYSICDGTVQSITNTQIEDISYNESMNDIGNSIFINCTNGYTAMYHHIKYKSTPEGIIIGTNVKKGDLLGQTSTTGLSTGPHLHLGLKERNGNLLDVMSYIDLINYKEAT